MPSGGQQTSQRPVPTWSWQRPEGPSKRPAADGQPRYYGRTSQGKTAIFPQLAGGNELVAVRITRTTSHTLFGDRIDEAV